MSNLDRKKVQVLEFTGERYIPEKCGSTDEISLEHQHRYSALIDLVKDKRVLDIACGEGFGSDLLSRSASSVVGIDIFPQAVDHASSKYKKANLGFQVGNVRQINLPDKSVDVIVSFETIEHVSEEDQRIFLSEALRVLDPAGVLIISTPNKLIYSDMPKNSNPFHIKEFYRDEFIAFLKTRFSSVRLFEQAFEVCSVIADPASKTTKVLDVQATGQPQGKYMVAVCSLQRSSIEKYDLSSIVHESSCYNFWDLRHRSSQLEIIQASDYYRISQWFRNFPPFMAVYGFLRKIICAIVRKG